MDVVIVDMDGVVANDSHRKHLAELIPSLPADMKQAGWDNYHGAMEFDEPNDEIVKLVNKLSETNIIAIVTGRPAKYRDQTEKQLREWDVVWDNLYMRPDGDKKSAVILKKEVVMGFIKYGLNVTMAIDDRFDICTMYREFNLTTLEIEDGKIKKE